MRRSGTRRRRSDLTDEQARQIVAFETGLFTAQVATTRRQPAAEGARGGPGRCPAAILHRDQRSGWLEPDRRVVRPERVHAVRCLGALKGTPAIARRTRAGHRARREPLQHQADHDQRRRRVSTARLCQRRHGARFVHRHVHDLPRLAECGQPLGEGAAQHRPDRCRAGAVSAGLHAAEPVDAGDRANDRSGPRDDHRKMGGHRQVQGPGPAGAGRARAVLPQRLGRDARGSGRVLRHRFNIGLTGRRRPIWSPSFRSFE